MATEQLPPISMNQAFNAAATTLSAGITSGATSLTVSGSNGFPSSAQYRILIDSEILLVTAGAGGGTWTVTRAQEGTSAAAHASGAPVTQVLSAGAIQNMTFSGNISGSSTTSAPAAGGASALPATPTGYLTVTINGTSRQIAFY